MTVNSGQDGGVLGLTHPLWHPQDREGTEAAAEARLSPDQAGEASQPLSKTQGFGLTFIGCRQPNKRKCLFSQR